MDTGEDTGDGHTGGGAGHGPTLRVPFALLRALAGDLADAGDRAAAVRADGPPAVDAGPASEVVAAALDRIHNGLADLAEHLRETATGLGDSADDLERTDQLVGDFMEPFLLPLPRAEEWERW